MAKEAEHGTMTRFGQHIRAGENWKACEPCYLAKLEYQRAHRQGNTKRRICVCCTGGINSQTDPAQDMCFKCRRRNGKRPRCGTLEGHRWHEVVRHEEACPKCTEVYKKHESGVTMCINPKCFRKVITKSDYCGRCKEGAIIGWMVHKGVRKPIYHIKGGTHVQQKKAS